MIYAGSLINTELLAYCPPQAECHDSAALHLEQILDLMEAGVKAGKTVVRLQTGDVSLYGSVREQGEELTRRGIRWQVVPGVSAFLGAAAELGVEYTVPEVSQSLIITRLEGRTPVPAREQLEAFASHQTSMAIYLSVQRIHRVAERLVEGGYPATTPVAVIHKATSPESQTVRGTLADIGDKVRDAGIRKTALIWSAPSSAMSITTQNCTQRILAMNTVKPESIALFCLTPGGVRLAKRLAAMLPLTCYTSEALQEEGFIPFNGGFASAAREAFSSFSALIFIGATGIAVRVLAPLVNDKLSDPAVVVIDERARHVISLLSGHAGGQCADPLSRRDARRRPGDHHRHRRQRAGRPRHAGLPAERPDDRFSRGGENR